MFLKLTSPDNEPVYVNMDLVATITHSADITAIHFAVPRDSEVRFVLVKETPADIAELVRVHTPKVMVHP